VVVGRRAGGEGGFAFVNGITRRHVLAVAAGAAGVLALRTAAPAQGARESHGMSAFGDLKYPPDFKQLDYVNPNAPKGGLFSQLGATRQYNQNFLTFNSFNSYILRGDAALGMERTFATLMSSASDEPDSMYGLAAQAVEISDDGLTYRFLMRPKLTFHDGSPLTAQDVAFSINILKEKGHPIIQTFMRECDGAQAADDASVTVRFKPKRGRDVPLLVAALPIFSRAYYGKRPFEESTLDIPLGSGPYKVGRHEVGRYVEYDRVKDWWGAGLPTQRGLHNFDVLRYEYYRDRDVAFEGFTGKNYLFREEFTSRIWATRYDFPAIRDGRVKRDVLADETPSGAQGWFINTRREKFKSPLLREAMIYAFDFEWTNRTIMYGSYDRTHSVFQNSAMMAKGPPSEDELKLLEPYRGKVSDEVFGEPFVPPVSDGSGQDRNLLRHASQLLSKAGYPVKDGKRMTPSGERMTIEFLLDEPSFQAHHMPYIKNLGLLGIDANVRMVDPVQRKYRRTISTSMSRSSASASRWCRAIRCAPTSRRVRPRSGGRKILPAYPIR
jgi:microcin C transport system substrate-binding protein